MQVISKRKLTTPDEIDDVKKEVQVGATKQRPLGLSMLLHAVHRWVDYFEHSRACNLAGALWITAPPGVAHSQTKPLPSSMSLSVGVQ